VVVGGGVESGFSEKLLSYSKLFNISYFSRLLIKNSSIVKTAFMI